MRTPIRPPATRVLCVTAPGQAHINYLTVPMDLFLKNQPPNHRNIKHFFVCFLKPRLTKLLLSLFPGAFIRKPSQMFSQWCRLTLTVNNTRLEVQCRAQVLSVWFSGFIFGLFLDTISECQCCLCGGEEMLSPDRYCFSIHLLRSKASPRIWAKMFQLCHEKAIPLGRVSVGVPWGVPEPAWPSG